MEAMSSVAIAAIVVLGAVGTYSSALKTRADAGREWTAFTIAQTRMELLASAPRAHAMLDDVASDSVTVLGGSTDAQCDTGVDGRLSPDLRVDEQGNPDPGGEFLLCWKVTGGNPSGSLKNVRVVAGYPSGGEHRYVLLQTIR